MSNFFFLLSIVCTYCLTTLLNMHIIIITIPSLLWYKRFVVYRIEDKIRKINTNESVYYNNITVGRKSIIIIIIYYIALLCRKVDDNKRSLPSPMACVVCSTDNKRNLFCCVFGKPFDKFESVQRTRSRSCL